MPDNKTIVMAPSGNQGGKRMWPSLPTANHIADIANWFLIASLVVGVVSTILIVWMAGVKEAYWEQDRRESSERIAALDSETAKANAEAAQANLELAKLKAPRALSQEQIEKISEEIKAFAGTNFDTASTQDGEAIGFLTQMESVLVSAGWVQADWVGGALLHDRPGKRNAGIVGATGVIVQIDASKSLSFSAAAIALVSALRAIGIEAAMAVAAVPNSTTDAIHVVIGKKI
jgi:hypothetical protein